MMAWDRGLGLVECCFQVGCGIAGNQDHVSRLLEVRERREQLILLWSRSSGDPIVTGVLGWQSCSNLTEAGASARIVCCP